MFTKPSIFEEPKQIEALQNRQRLDIETAVQQHIESVESFELEKGPMGSDRLKLQFEAWKQGLDQKIPKIFKKIYDKKMKG